MTSADPLAIWAHRAWGRPSTHRWQVKHGDPPDKPGYAATALGVLHCGAGCTLGDIIAEFAEFGLGASVAGVTLGAEYLGDYLAAIVLGVIFQYFAIALRVLPPRTCVRTARRTGFSCRSA